MSDMPSKPTLAMYWAAGCGGCEVAVLNIFEHLLEVDELFEIAFFPCIADFKVADVEGYADDHIDICLFNGAIRNSENREMAELLRRKSKLLVAFGSCAYEGCIPALANLTSNETTFQTVYLDNPSTENPEGTTPQTSFVTPEGELELPELFNRVRSLDQVVDVDYTIPGCPPEPHQIWTVLQAVAAALHEGAELPPAGSMLGAGTVAVCEECNLKRDVKSVDRFHRPHEIVPEPGICLLEQGLVCMGVATRSGCGALCPRVGIGCRGCYGPVEGVEDQGMKMVSAIASICSTNGADETALDRNAGELAATIADPAGTFYRFSMAHSELGRTGLIPKNERGPE